MKQRLTSIPESFWSLFRSRNMKVYMEAILRINEEYQYSNYFLSKEVCIQILNDYFAKELQSDYSTERDELEEEEDILEPAATRIFHWLLKAQWLRKVNDYNTMTENIVIPDYAAIFVEAFEHLYHEEEDATQIYIQNIYAIIYSFLNDPRANVSLLNTAIVNTRKLNKSLQDMLFNMDKFFSNLLSKDFYGDLLKEHLDGYVEEIVRKKYHILKTSDNFYLYKSDIKRWMNDMRQNTEWLENLCRKNNVIRGDHVEVSDLIEQIDMIERGFDDIEHRIANMDKEHSKYIRATVTRLNYLLNEEDNMKGMVIQLLNHLSRETNVDEKLQEIGNYMNLSQMNVLSRKSFYQPRKPKQSFVENLVPDEEVTELSREEIMKLNKIKSRYSKKQIAEFVSEHMTNGRMMVDEQTVKDDEDFYRLVLAYDYSTRKECPYRMTKTDVEEIDNGAYRYPKFVFEMKRRAND